VLSRRFAYIAVLFIVVQDYLFQQLPAIARQEIALLFFVCLVAAMLDSRLRRGAQIGLLAVFGVGLVLVGNATQATPDPTYAKQVLLRRVLKATILTDFVVNFYVFPLGVEIVLKAPYAPLS
jgi:uncharacterized membrane protein